MPLARVEVRGLAGAWRVPSTSAPPSLHSLARACRLVLAATAVAFGCFALEIAFFLFIIFGLLRGGADAFGIVFETLLVPFFLVSALVYAFTARAYLNVIAGSPRSARAARNLALWLAALAGFLLAWFFSRENPYAFGGGILIFGTCLFLASVGWLFVSALRAKPGDLPA
jgi:hypothetical protein